MARGREVRGRPFGRLLRLSRPCPILHVPSSRSVFPSPREVLGVSGMPAAEPMNGGRNTFMTLCSRIVRLVSALALPFLFPIAVSAQQPAPTGSIAGRVVDENGAGVANAQIYLDRPAIGTQTRADGAYTLG